MLLKIRSNRLITNWQRKTILTWIPTPIKKNSKRLLTHITFYQNRIQGSNMISSGSIRKDHLGLTKHNPLTNNDSNNGIHLIRNVNRMDLKHITIMKRLDTDLMGNSKREGRSSTTLTNFTKILWMRRRNKTKVIEMRESSLRILKDILNQSMITKNNTMLLIRMIQTTLSFERNSLEICLLVGVY